jgi:hypothetical protein
MLMREAVILPYLYGGHRRVLALFDKALNE